VAAGVVVAMTAMNQAITEVRPPRAPSVALLFAMLFAGQLGSNIYLPGLPDIANDLHATMSDAQTMVAVYLAAFGLAQLVMGPLSDRFGRRPTIIGGLTLFSLASGLCALAPDIGTLLMARLAQATGACATMVVGRAMIRDTSEGVAAARAMSWLAIAMGIGPATAPFIGGFLTAWFGWQSTFIFTALVAAGVFAFVVFDLEETLPPAMRSPPRVGQLLFAYGRLARNPEFVGYGLIVSFASGAMQAYLTAVPIIFLVLMGVSPEVFGFYIMIMPTLYVIATYTSRRLTMYMPIDRIILIGVACSATGGLLQVLVGLWGVSTPYPILAAFAISNFGTGMVLANCYAMALSTVSPAIAGQASALGGFMHMGWGAVLSFVVARLNHTSSLPFGFAQMTTTWLAAATALLLVFVIKRRMTAKTG
jgi:DHA1 family bicyclomycin/chloramphenicol resistance-like MFS transporter